MRTLLDISCEVSRLAAKIEAQGQMLPTFGQSEDGARPHIEIDETGLMHYIVIERGREFERKSTSDIDELMKTIFKSVSFNMACEYELKNRVQGQDFRRVLFKRQTELLSALDENWARENEHRVTEILREHPYDDHSDLRVAYWRELRNAGYPENEIAKCAYAKYPLPSRDAD